MVVHLRTTSGAPRAISYYPDDLQQARLRLAEVLDDPARTFTYSVRISAADGSWRVMEAASRNLLDRPRVHGIVVTLRDITERTVAEETLAWSERRYRTLFNGSPVSWECDITRLRQRISALRAGQGPPTSMPCSTGARIRRVRPGQHRGHHRERRIDEPVRGRHDGAAWAPRGPFSNRSSAPRSAGFFTPTSTVVRASAGGDHANAPGQQAGGDPSGNARRGSGFRPHAPPRACGPHGPQVGEAALRNLIAQSPEMIIVADESGRTIDSTGARRR